MNLTVHITQLTSPSPRVAPDTSPPAPAPESGHEPDRRADAAGGSTGAGRVQPAEAARPDRQVLPQAEAEPGAVRSGGAARVERTQRAGGRRAPAVAHPEGTGRGRG